YRYHPEGLGLQARSAVPARQLQQPDSDRRLHSLRHEAQGHVPADGRREPGPACEASGQIPAHFPADVRQVMLDSQTSQRHGRACPGHPRLSWMTRESKSWMAGTGPAMTGLGLCFLSSIMFAEPLHAQSVEDFYRGKTINLIIGYSVGGGYDL